MEGLGNIHYSPQDKLFFQIDISQNVIIVGHTPTSVCFSNNVRGALPARRTLFRRPIVEQPLRAVKKKEIFELAKISTNFYKLIIELQVKNLNVKQIDVLFC